MAILTATAMEGYRKFTERSIQKARYKLGNTWHEAEVVRKERMQDNRVAVYIPILPQSSTAVTITGMELQDRNGVVFASKTESIRLNRVQEGVLYRFTFDLREVEEEES